MRTIIVAIGILALAIGLLWISQGTGCVNLSQSRLMIRQMQWAYYGACVAVVGLLLIWRGLR